MASAEVTLFPTITMQVYIFSFPFSAKGIVAPGGLVSYLKTIHTAAIKLTAS